MKLDFQLTESDLHEFYKFNEWYSPDKKRFRLKRRLYLGTLMSSLPFISFIMSAEPFSSPMILNLLFLGLVLFNLGFFGAKQVALLNVERWVNDFLKKGKNQDLIGRRTMEFKDHEIESHTTNSDDRINTEMIEKIREDENYYFIYLTTISAHIIPKRIFETEASKKEFSTWLKQNVTFKTTII